MWGGGGGWVEVEGSEIEGDSGWNISTHIFLSKSYKTHHKKSYLLHIFQLSDSIEYADFPQ